MRDSAGPCLPDMRVEVPGIQKGAPRDDYVRGEDKPCHIDKCLNLPGCQAEIPSDRKLNAKQQCVLIDPLKLITDPDVEPTPSAALEELMKLNDSLDLCPEIPGIQKGAPRDDYVMGEDKLCHIDKCLNLPGYQADIPNDRKRNTKQQCVLIDPIERLTESMESDVGNGKLIDLDAIVNPDKPSKEGL